MNKRFMLVFIVATLTLASCGTPQNGTTYIVPQQINDPQISEITPVYETQVERVNNCDGTNPIYNVSYKTIEVQRASFEVTVGAGGLVTGTPVPSVLEVQLEARITAALAKDYGLTTEKNHDLTLNNVTGTFLEHTIIWKVTRVKGLIDVIYGDGTAQVGFEKIANVELYNRTSVPLDCNNTNLQSPPTSTTSIEIPVATLETESPQVSTPEIPVILPTAAPVSIGNISVAGNSSEGTKFTATQTGIYIFKYIGGSYSTYPSSKKPPVGTLTWLTGIRVFKNRAVEWNGIAISDYSDYRAVDYAYYASASEVENIAKGSILTVSLQKGDYLIFVAVDELPYYSDNPGEVKFEVLYTPNQ